MILTVTVSCLDLSVTTWSLSPPCQSWLHGSGCVNTASTSGRTSGCLTFSPIPTIGSRMLRSIKLFVWRFVRMIRLVCTRRKRWLEWWARETLTVWSRREIFLALFNWKFGYVSWCAHFDSLPGPRWPCSSGFYSRFGLPQWMLQDRCSPHLM